VTQRLTSASHRVTAGDSGVCLELSGEFDAMVVGELDGWFTEAFGNLPAGSVLTLDFSSVTFCDAGCTAIVARHYYRLTAAGVRVQALGVRGMVAKVFVVLGLGELIG
jgi:anti-anti-sigma factor